MKIASTLNVIMNNDVDSFEVKIMFKRKLLSVLVATTAVGFGGFAMNASAADGTGNASATIVAPISVNEAVAGGMNFGSVSPDFTNPTTVVLTPTGGISSGDGAGLISGTGVQQGSFDVTGANLAYDIGLPVAPTDSITLTNGAGDTMTVDTFTSSKASGVSANGDTFSVGATLNVGANQAAGAPYTGTYTVTVTYQ